MDSFLFGYALLPTIDDLLPYTHLQKRGGTIRVTIFKGKAIRIQLLKITSAQT